MTAAVIERYQRAADEQDWDSLVACFTEDATVQDEGNRYQGRDAIRAWREQAAAKYTFTSSVIETKETGNDAYEVTGILRGNFPGGEATLTSAFTLRGGLISELTMT